MFSEEAHFWLQGYVNKQKFRISSDDNLQAIIETPLHSHKALLGVLYGQRICYNYNFNFANSFYKDIIEYLSYRNIKNHD